MTPKILLAVELLLLATGLLELRRHLTSTKARAKPGLPTMRVLICALVFVLILVGLVIGHYKPGLFGVVREYRQILFTGVWLTLGVSCLAILFGTVVGVLAALSLVGQKWPYVSFFVDSSILVGVYILLGVPALILLYLVYYGVVGSLFWAAVVALSINLSPFVAKIVASSIRNISQEQIDAAVAFGYSPRQITRFFKIGFVIRNSLQPLLVEYYTTIKLSSFAGLIGLSEVYHASQEMIKETQDPVTAYIVLAIAYVCIVTPFAMLADYLEQKSKKAIG
jgi:ABC-type amino acid transport system permease subunit